MNRLSKFLGLVGLALASLACPAQTKHTVANRDTPNTFTASPNQFTLGITAGPITFSTLTTGPSQGNGTTVYCQDCVVQNPCAGGGPGAFAQRVGGIWQCATNGGGGGGGGGSVTSVAQTVPSWLSVAGSPIFTSGTLAISAATGQTSHQVIGTGSGTSFAPTTLGTADLPFTYSGNTTVLGTVTGSFTTNHLIKVDASGNLIDAGSAGSGTVTSFSAGNLSPLFTSSVATATTTPALTFALSTAAAHTAFMNNTGSTAAPGFQTIGTADLPFTYSGSTTKLATSSGALTNGHCVSIDASGNYVDFGSSCGSPPGTGTVTSVGLGAPSGFVVSGSPVLSAGTLTFTMPASWATGALLVGNGGNSVITLGIGTNGQGLLSNGTTAVWGAVGTVTSVGLTVPSWLTVSGSPITGAGTLAVTAAGAQTANKVIGTGSGSSFSPVSLTTSDLPFTYGGNTTKLGTTTGALTNGDCVSIDANGNFVDASFHCGSGSGTINSGTNNTIAKYVGSTTVGNSGITDNGTAVATSETFSASQLISTVAIGTAPLTVTSTTVVPNLNVSQLLGQTWAVPAAIGSTTPNSATFVNLTINGTCTGCTTGAVLLAPAGDQTITGSHQLINLGTNRTGPPLSSFSATVQGAAFDASTGQVGISGQNISSGTFAGGVQGIAQGIGSSGVFALAYDSEAATTSIPYGIQAQSYLVTTANNPNGAAVAGGFFSFATPSVGTTVGFADGLESEVVVNGPGVVTTASDYNALLPGVFNGGTFTAAYAFHTAAPFSALSAQTAILHAVDQGPGASHYGILFEGVTHNDLGAGITKVGNLTISQIGGSTQCLQVNASGVVSGTGTACGAGGGGAVSSVFGRTGAVVATSGDYTVAQVTNAVSTVPGATQTIQPTLLTATGLVVKCPASAAGTLACLQAQDNAGGNIVSFLQNDTTQFGTGVGGNITLTAIVGPNASPATVGLVRNSTTDQGVCWRSNDNTTNYCLAKTAANIITSDLALAIKETAAGSGIAGYGVIYEDSSTHLLQASTNNGSFLVIPQETGAMTSGHLVSVNATTNLIADSGIALTSVATSTPTNHGVALGSATQALSFTSAGTSGQCLLSGGAAADPTFSACPGGGSAALSAITAAVGSNSINNGDNPQVWNFQGTTASRIAFKFTENAASTSTGTPVLFQVSAIAASTMNPVQFDFNGNGIRMNTSGQIASIGTGGILPTALTSVTGSGAAVLATSATNVTLDAEGSGNVLTRPFYVEFTGGCNNATASPGAFDLPTSAAATFTCFGSTTTQGVLDFVDGSTTTATGHFTLPQGWTGNMDARLYWFANASSANAARWSVQTGCIADTEAFSTGPSYNTASQTNTAYTGTANQRKTTTLSAVSMTNCSAGETMYFQVSRIGGDAGDTLTATAELVSLQWEGRTTK